MGGVEWKVTNSCEFYVQIEEDLSVSPMLLRRNAISVSPLLCNWLYEREQIIPAHISVALFLCIQYAYAGTGWNFHIDSI